VKNAYFFCLFLQNLMKMRMIADDFGVPRKRMVNVPGISVNETMNTGPVIAVPRMPLCIPPSAHRVWSPVQSRASGLGGLSAGRDSFFREA
jgi:hypothetical protein